MLDIALSFLRDELNSFLAIRTGSDAFAAKLSRIVDDGGKYAITLDSLALSLIHVEEERIFRAQLPSQTFVNGRQVLQEPELKLNLTVMVAANFKNYDEALKSLSLVLTFFQSNGTFVPGEYPGLDPRIEKLTTELLSLSFEQMNQMWGFIGAKLLPAVVYKVRMVIVQDTQPSDYLPPVTTINASYGLR
jgi:hypothetical protein